LSIEQVAVEEMIVKEGSIETLQCYQLCLAMAIRCTYGRTDILSWFMDPHCLACGLPVPPFVVKVSIASHRRQVKALTTPAYV
jgi:hypothetical protein